MKNAIANGERFTTTAPSDTGSVDLSAGDGCLIGNIFGVAVNDAAMGETVVLALTGVFDLAKNSAEAWAEGDLIYWDDTNHQCTTTVGSNTLIGAAWKAAANPSSSGQVRLNSTAG